MQETLGAALIALSGWHGQTPIYDPMCGSGTLLCEAMMTTCRIPAGFFRKKFGFFFMPDFQNKIWENIKQRCNNPKNTNYHYYGGRGIKICDAWANDFSVFRKWAESNGYKNGLTIERKDNNKGYTPENCTWATKLEQNMNRRNTIKYKGENTIEAAKRLGCTPRRIRMRIYEGWSVEKAFTTYNINAHHNTILQTVRAQIDGLLELNK
jgi:hypothetical protein